MKVTEADLQIFKDAVDQIDWNITHLESHELEDLKKKYSYEENNYKREDLAERIRNDIRSTLSASEGGSARKLCSSVHRMFLFRAYIDKKDDWIYANVSGQLFHVFQGQKISILEPKTLRAALEMLREKMRLYNTKVSDTQSDYSDSRVLAISNSVSKLKNDYSISYLIQNGNVLINETEFLRVGAELSRKMESFGGLRFVCEMFQKLEEIKRYSHSFRRYFFPIPSSQVNDKLDPTVPWGYLYNLAMRFPHFGREGSNLSELWKELITHSTSLVSALDVEPYSIWDTEFREGESTFEMLSEVSLLESNFRIPQVRSSDLMSIIKGLFSWTKDFEQEHFDLSYSDINYFSNRLLKYLSSSQSQVIDLAELKTILKRLPDEKFDKILMHFCHDNYPNSEFVSPVDYQKVDAFFKPLIATENKKILMPSPSWSSYALLEAILTYYRNLIPNFDSQMGDHLESFVIENLSRVGISVLSGEYKNSEGELAEIDVAMEFDDLIVIIEIKKKSLTRLSKSGHGGSLLVDIHKSLLDSQHQALGHEYSLMKDGEIKFKDGSMLKLNQRRVEKISMVLFDYGAIQDRTIIKQLLVFYLQCRFNVDEANDKSFSELNKKCDKFCERYNKYVSVLGEMENIPFFGSWFLSLPQFLILMDNVKSSKDFKAALWNTKFMTMKTLDWYWEHNEMLKIKSR